MTAAVLTNALLGVLAVVMAGLGLSLTLDDFRRLRDHPLAAVLALGLQVLVLPLVCVAVIAAFQLPPLYAVGLMLLAASPGGITANLFSHLFGGHVAMNLSLTALNTVLSLATLPLIANWAIAHYAGGGQVVPLPWQKLAEVIGVIAVPVLLGMAVRRSRPDLAARLDKPVKALSAVLLVVLTVAAIAKEREALMSAAGELGGAVLAFNVLSLAAGYGLGRVARLPRSLCIAIGFEVGVHNSTLALYLALGVLQQFPVALPAALYSVSMYVTALLFGLWLRRHSAA
ncbi:bile acid:sodium symporter family protein [Pelomonas sp. UHG3]|uniref:Bile acid:sodium symporter family protein n=1 Tax=Roseateles hydrophilus TaxID=2975054 RepID=A0ACC6CA93_9BURK|nr:bile acid:sodium symporter family protein [Pelomonas sp. UHG3]MCY4745305.1 bile acid:sodium symporter family protein [Pelomonas sp. UHG3]